MEEDRNAFKILTGKPARKRPLGRIRRRWRDNVRTDHKEMGVNMRNWIDQDRYYWRALSECATEPRFHKPWSYYYMI